MEQPKKKRGRPRKYPVGHTQTTKKGKKGRPKKDKEAEIELYKKQKNKKTKFNKKYAIIVKVNIKNYDWSFLVGKKVKLKENPSHVSDDFYYGSILDSDYKGVDMMFDKDELEII